MSITDQEIKKQSLAAFGQWRRDWISNAKLNKPYLKQSFFRTLGNVGKDKVLFIVANGPSLSQHWNVIKENQHRSHVLCVDKAFRPLMEHGIVPTYVVLCDANVNYEKYCAGLDTSKTVLLSNMCGEHNWVKTWKGPIFFFINQDSIKSENLFTNITGYQEYIPAASNVSNCAIVLAQFVLKYKWNLMTGYDYSWPLGTYYSTGAEDKECWMASQIFSDVKGNFVRTSSNLVFSNKWISQMFETSKGQMGNFINCSEQGLFLGPKIQSMETMVIRVFRGNEAPIGVASV